MGGLGTPYGPPAQIWTALAVDDALALPMPRGVPSWAYEGSGTGAGTTKENVHGALPGIDVVRRLQAAVRKSLRHGSPFSLPAKGISEVVQRRDIGIVFTQRGALLARRHTPLFPRTSQLAWMVTWYGMLSLKSIARPPSAAACPMGKGLIELEVSES